MSATAVEQNGAPETVDVDLPEYSIPYREGGEYRFKFSVENFKAAYRDEYTGEQLPNHLVRQAMCEEMSYFNSVVWELVETEKAKAENDFKLIRTRWVVSNKGDADSPDIRARLVACEVNQYKTDMFHASTLPPEANHIFVSHFASENVDAVGEPPH